MSETMHNSAERGLAQTGEIAAHPRTAAMRWTRERTALLALVCLLAGTAGGWSIRGMRAATAAQATVAAAAVKQESAPAPQPPGPAQWKEMADAQAAPLIEKLKSNPDDADLLASIGNLYYDAQQYPIAVDFYARTLKLKPADAAVRTDMGTAFWFMGNADRAIAEFDKALAYLPDNPNTLFNLGLVKWKGKTDAAGAIAAWEKLLATDPNYQQKKQVEQMLDEARNHVAGGAVAKSN
jgi:tetratricopeptide (TPR) repeat protein